MPIRILLFFRAGIQPLPRPGTTDHKELAPSSKVERNFKETGEMANKHIGALVWAQGLMGTSVLCCVIANISTYEFCDFTLQKVQAGYGLCVPMEGGAHPSNKYTAWEQMPRCCSHSHPQPAQQHVGSRMLCPSSSAPLSLHIPAVWKEDSGTYPHLHGETSLPLQADFRSHHYSGGKSWMQSQEPACQSPLKGRIAGWMSQLCSTQESLIFLWEWSA